MHATHALRWIMALGVAGVLFSGTLVWREMAVPSLAGCSTTGAPGAIFGVAPCVYGLIMYAALTLIAWFGLRGAYRRRVMSASSRV